VWSYKEGTASMAQCPCRVGVDTEVDNVVRAIVASVFAAVVSGGVLSMVWCHGSDGVHVTSGGCAGAMGCLAICVGGHSFARNMQTSICLVLVVTSFQAAV